MMSTKQVYCPHCHCEVAERTYRQHKAVHFNNASQIWLTTDTFSPPRKRRRQISSQSESFDVTSSIETEPLQTEFDISASNASITSVKDSSEDLESIQLDPVHTFITEKFEEVWENISIEDIVGDLCTEASEHPSTTVNTSGVNDTKKESLLEISRWIVLFVGSWSTAYNIPMTAIGYFLLFLHALLVVCSTLSPALRIIADIVPKSVYSLKKAQGFLVDDFTKYIVCPTCHSVYELSACLTNNTEPSKCSHVPYPNHPQRRFRQKCNTVLFKDVILTDGTKKHYPIKTYCFRSIKKSLKTFLDRKGFQNLCDAWKGRKRVPGTLRDVYDGRVWRDFQYIEAKGPFLELPRRYGLILNVDWFQPYKHSPYSVGVIYLALLNLPREKRYSKENVIIAGVIPGPDEPSKHINTYLRPIVDELNELWETGFSYKGIDDEKVASVFLILIL